MCACSKVGFVLGGVSSLCVCESNCHSKASMAPQATSVFVFAVMLSVLHSSVADPVVDTKLQAGELDVLRSDIAALKPRVAAGKLKSLQCSFGD
jgi:hypothetical protein